VIVPSRFLVPLLCLLLLANGTPLAVRSLLGKRLAYPVDGDHDFVDGRPLFGPAKTLRGIACALAVTTAAGPVVGLDWQIGLVVGSLAMAGDLFSSFIKRRLGRPPSTPVVGLDQIPEALFPLLACMRLLSLTLIDVALGVALFFVGELLVSRLLYAFDLRERPY
jgi:CDP-2,3-bis-(O-geranylgeranyl)-sn-glycerol synthase